MTDTKPLVLFVDDLPDLRELYAVAVSRYSFNFNAVFAENVDEAMRLIREQAPDAVVLDVNLTGETGMDIAAHLSEFYPNTPKAVLTAYDLAMTRDAAGAYGMEVWGKPLTMADLIGRVEQLLASRRDEGSSGLAQLGGVARMLLAAAVGLFGGVYVPKVH